MEPFIYPTDRRRCLRNLVSIPRPLHLLRPGHLLTRPLVYTPLLPSYPLLSSLLITLFVVQKLLLI